MRFFQHMTFSCLKEALELHSIHILIKKKIRMFALFFLRWTVKELKFVEKYPRFWFKVKQPYSYLSTGSSFLQTMQFPTLFLSFSKAKCGD